MPSIRERVPPISITSIVNDTRMHIGVSMRILLRENTTGENRAQMPKMKRVLKIFDPTTLPIAISALPENAEAKLTVSSGSEVPTATMVIPMINSLMFNLFAMAEAPLVNQFAPKVISVKPTTRSIEVVIIIKIGILLNTAQR